MAMRQNIIRDESLMVNYAVVNGWTVVEVDGDVDIHTAGMVRDAVYRLLDEGHGHFVLDLGFVTFLDSMGLGAIIAAAKRVMGRGGSLRISAAPPLFYGFQGEIARKTPRPRRRNTLLAPVGPGMASPAPKRSRPWAA